jgi:hypothetical protein
MLNSTSYTDYSHVSPDKTVAITVMYLILENIGPVQFS